MTIATEITKQGCQMLTRHGMTAPGGFGARVDVLENGVQRLVLTAVGDGTVSASSALTVVRDASIMLLEMMGGRLVIFDDPSVMFHTRRVARLDRSAARTDLTEEVFHFTGGAIEPILARLAEYQTEEERPR